MKRRLFNLLTWISLLMGIGIVVLMIAGIFAKVHLEVTHWPQGRVDHAPATFRSFGAYRGGALITEIAFESMKFEFYPPRKPAVQVPGTNYWLETFAVPQSQMSFNVWDLRNYRDEHYGPGEKKVWVREMAFPLWPVAIVMIGLPTWVLLRRRRQTQRERQGRCLNCGYDLRATPDRCPECGAAAGNGLSAMVRPT